MVSKANDDLPEPDSPVMTVRLWLGMVTSIFFRLWTRAPKTSIAILFFLRVEQVKPLVGDADATLFVEGAGGLLEALLGALQEGGHDLRVTLIGQSQEAVV
jgi:hypothetical protein